MPAQDLGMWLNSIRQENMNRKPRSPWSILPGGQDIWKVIEQQMKGLSPEELAQLQGQAGGQMRSSEQQLREQFAGSGAPIGAQVGANIANRSNINRNLQQGILSGNLAAKGQGIQNYFGLEGLRQQGERDIFNKNFQMQQLKAQIDAQPGFLENLISGLAGMGGNAFGSWLGKKL